MWSLAGLRTSATARCGSRRAHSRSSPSLYRNASRRYRGSRSRRGSPTSGCASRDTDVRGCSHDERRVQRSLSAGDRSEPYRLDRTTGSHADGVRDDDAQLSHPHGRSSVRGPLPPAPRRAICRARAAHAQGCTPAISGSPHIPGIRRAHAPGACGAWTDGFLAPEQAVVLKSHPRRASAVARWYVGGCSRSRTTPTASVSSASTRPTSPKEGAAGSSTWSLHGETLTSSPGDVQAHLDAGADHVALQSIDVTLAAPLAAIRPSLPTHARP